jgi:hypothetical protein
MPCENETGHRYRKSYLTLDVDAVQLVCELNPHLPKKAVTRPAKKESRPYLEGRGDSKILQFYK